MRKGEHHTEAAKRKMSENRKGIYPSVAARQKMCKAQKGRRHSAATKQKMSENSGMKGKKHSDASKNKMREYAKGKHASEATRRKQSKIMKEIRASKGLLPGARERHRIRGQIEIRLWREAVFARDNWTCQYCGNRCLELNAHHIKSFAKYPKLRTSIENGIAMCKKCHKKKHSKPKGQL